MRNFDFMLFHYSITQELVVDTLKFISAGEVWTNLYASSCKGDAPSSQHNFTRGRVKS